MACQRSSFVDRAAVALALVATAGALVGGAIIRRATHRWGATNAEHRELLPGDELVTDPAIVASRAVTVDAPVGEVWSWLVQIGQNRGGMYSYDALENLLGLRIHSTDEIRPEWQVLEEGDRVVLVPPGWGGLKSGYALPVAVVDAPSTLVLRQSPPEHPWDAVWSFHLSALPDGRSRLLSRSRSRRHRGGRGVVDLAVDALMDPVTWFMTRKMLLGIKQRAEHRVPVRATGSSLERRLERDVALLHLPDSGERAVGLDLYWIPLGAGARVVRTSGRIYETLAAWREHRPRCDLFHSALVARLPGCTYFVEMTPVPAAGDDRGVVGNGAVGSRRLGTFRVFSYEIRRWRGGVIPDIGFAVASPVRVTKDEEAVRQAMAWVEWVPTPVWGRDELATGEMWNSNSVVSWVLERSGLLDAAGSPPTGGRAPGWNAGVTVARRVPWPGRACTTGRSETRHPQPSRSISGRTTNV